MLVFKFGGASVQDATGIVNLAHIVQAYKHEQLVIVVSAMGKTTNALEAIANAFYQHKKEEALALFTHIKDTHNAVAANLLGTQVHTLQLQLQDVYTEVEWLLHDEPVRTYAYYYDQIVSTGELLSTLLVSAYLTAQQLSNIWVDSRDYIITNDNYREAAVDMPATTHNLHNLHTLLATHSNVVLQGYIGATTLNTSTTLGREGSDYTAALVANILKAHSLTIWKDVIGVLNADPKQHTNPTLLPHLSYAEVIEMAYYGAQVIHPKTIKPLQNAGIPMYVKCFKDATLPGTCINDKPAHNLPPIIIIKNEQYLIQCTTKDYSFVGEAPMMELYTIMQSINLKPNLTQMGAITISLVLDNINEKVEMLCSQAALLFDVTVQKNMQLLTIRHYNQAVMQELTANKQFVLQQKTTDTYQALLQL